MFLKHFKNVAFVFKFPVLVLIFSLKKKQTEYTLSYHWCLQRGNWWLTFYTNRNKLLPTNCSNLRASITLFLKGIKEQPIQINNIEKTNKQKTATGSRHPLVALISSPIETDTASGQRGIWALGKHHEALSSASQFPSMRTRPRFQKCIKRAKRVW